MMSTPSGTSTSSARSAAVPTSELMSDSNSTTTTNELDRACDSIDTTPSTWPNASDSGSTSCSSTTSASSTNQVPDTTEIGVLIGGNPSRLSPNPNADNPATRTTIRKARVSRHRVAKNSAIVVMIDRRPAFEEGARTEGLQCVAWGVGSTLSTAPRTAVDVAVCQMSAVRSRGQVPVKWAGRRSRNAATPSR
jgi:hypothetical protein